MKSITIFLESSLLEMKDILKNQSLSQKDYKINTIINVNNKMQKNYSYKLTAPIGKQFDPQFNPAYTPKQMLEMGVFEGKYCNDQLLEFPKEWYLTALSRGKLSPDKPNPNINYYKVKSRQSLQVWRKNNWIYGDDPRGWFEWYMRYYLGRRDPKIDQIQIKRWKHNIAHLGGLKKQCPNLDDPKCGLVRKQLLLQWSYPMK